MQDGGFGFCLSEDMRERVAHLTCAAQGLYFVISGVWPVVHLESFMRVTGPKTDDWLVQAFGLLVAGVGVVLVRAWLRGRSRTVADVALATASTLAFIDVWFVARGRVPPIYLADAAVESAFVVAWIIVLVGTSTTSREDGLAQPTHAKAANKS
jgi:hypothetical protein